MKIVQTAMDVLIANYAIAVSNALIAMTVMIVRIAKIAKSVLIVSSLMNVATSKK